MATWLTAQEAAKRLGVSRPTLYAYVSRGLVHSTPAPDHPHARRYAREDIERLRQRAEQRRHPEKVMGRALHWGMPLLESSITLVAGNRLYYRGYDACELSHSRSIAEVASLIWLGSFEAHFSAGDHQIAASSRQNGRSFVARAQSTLSLVATRDRLAFDLRPSSVAHTGWRILNLLTSAAVESPNAANTVDETLRRHWAPRVPHAARLLRAALIVCADHELNVSSFTARCVASAGANPYMVVIAGLAATEGTKHGGITARIETMFNELRRARDLNRAIADRLRRGEPLYGFGHPLYEDGDPRAKLVLDLLQELHPKSHEVHMAGQIARAGAEILNGEKPTIDFALVALSQALKLPAGAPLTIFALGRTIGWIGHAMEQYARDEIIRPRAKYVGVMP